MRKSLVFSILTMIFLFFLWWLSGGTIVNVQRRPAPIETATAFVWENFQVGLATVFDLASRLLPF